MDEKFKSLPLRDGVGIVVLNKNNKIFVAKRIDNPKNYWQMPQGGVNQGEDFLKAAFRELEEETSIKSVKLIKELDGTITYELPDRLLGIIWKGKYKGQKQKWFLMKFTGEEKEINIQTKNPEFLEWKWIDLDQITDVVVDFKLHVYQELKEKIKKIIN
ncbi:RNA pyrophosphohydrolase [Pelagibacterales bacterium SAG-MED10]|nr:RNA pyrophosphohydrolase [Pelagibacterales bacterium SAG-MED19]MBD1166005.1 RNA pyrophosphohydrolase [Pelagibacterales bacterium SAG-MED10]